MFLTSKRGGFLKQDRKPKCLKGKIRQTRLHKNLMFSHGQIPYKNINIEMMGLEKIFDAYMIGY